MPASAWLTHSPLVTKLGFAWIVQTRLLVQKLQGTFQVGAFCPLEFNRMLPGCGCLGQESQACRESQALRGNEMLPVPNCDTGIRVAIPLGQSGNLKPE